MAPPLSSEEISYSTGNGVQIERFLRIELYDHALCPAPPGRCAVRLPTASSFGFHVVWETFTIISSTGERDRNAFAHGIPTTHIRMVVHIHRDNVTFSVRPHRTGAAAADSGLCPRREGPRTVLRKIVSSPSNRRRADAADQSRSRRAADSSVL